MKINIILVFLTCQSVIFSRGITSVVGASCLYVASNFTSFPFDCQIPDLAFKCRCGDPSFLGTVVNCIESHSLHSQELSKAYNYLINVCQAQGGKQWTFIDMAKINDNATAYLVDFTSLPIPKYKSSIVLKENEVIENNLKKNTNEHYELLENKIAMHDVLKQSEKFTLRNPVIVPNSLYNISFNSVSTLSKQRKLATIFGLTLYGYWGLIMLIAMMANIIKWCSPYYHSRLSKTKFSLWVKRNVICPQFIKPKTVVKIRNNNTNLVNQKIDEKRALTAKQKKLLDEDNVDTNNLQNIEANNGNHGSNKNSHIFKNKLNSNLNSFILNSIYNIPVRMHAIVIILYIGLTVFFCCYKYEFFYPNTVFTCHKGQKFVGIADRTGIIGTIQLPIVFLFSTRNNILSNITGLSYRTFQMFHKWTSMVTFILLILHCAFYLSYVNVKGDYIERWGLLKWRCANASFVALVVTIMWAYTRRLFYEWFKLSHKILLIIFVVGAWYHCFTLGWIEYIAASFIIWSLEYFLRICKIISSGGLLKARCSLLYEVDNNLNKSVPHSIRIVVNHSGWWKPFPGSYCWIYFLKKDMFWQAHPFTIISAASAKNYNQLIFLIRVKKGITKKLAKYISKLKNSTCDFTIMIEGPYGNNIPFKSYDHSVLVAGGVGMAVIYSIAMDLAQIYNAQILRGKKHLTEKIISIIWVIPNLESLMAFRDEIENLTQFSGIVEIQIFITRPLLNFELKNAVDSNSNLNLIFESDFAKTNYKNDIPNDEAVFEIINNKSSNEEETIFESDGCFKKEIDVEKNDQIINEQKNEMKVFLKWLLENNSDQISFNFESKPNIEIEMFEFLKKIDRTIALIACGPTNLNADVRLAVVKCLKNGKNVDYFEEELLW